MSAMDSWNWKEFSESKSRDLDKAYDIVAQAFKNQSIPQLQDVPASVLQTSAATAALGLLLVLLLIPALRRFVLNTVDTTLAVVCLILLLGVVIGMPFGALYIGSRGLGFLASSLLHAFPQLGALLSSIQSLLGFGK